MSATPRRVSGAYPATPATTARGFRAPPTPSPTPDPPVSRSSRSSTQRSPLPLAPQNRDASAPTTEPLIPTTIIDAPTQRLYAFGVYAALFAWRLYDWVQLVDDNTESLWLFLKWVGIDFLFLFGLPELRIPWLELSQPVVVALCFIHAVLDWMLMFNIPIPFTAWLLGFVRVFYDREVSISEQYVRVSNILHNSSLIMGKQIIDILPEGSAVLNPNGDAFCLGGDYATLTIPIHFNATVPEAVELIRIDLESGNEEVLKLKKGQIREIAKLAKRQAAETDPGVVKYDYPVKKPGAYRLGRVLDEYKLEVQRKTQNTFVVPCPKARVASSPSADRCLGDLSDLSLEVEGTPPLKIVYSRTINGHDRSFHFQSLQPEGFSSPLLGSLRTSSLIIPDSEDISWARAQKVTVGLNESMNVGGDWQYSVDEVQDAFGNTAKYVSPADDPELRPKPKHLVQNFLVKERPKVWFEGCDSRNSLKVAKGESAKLPVRFNLPGRRPESTVHTLTWLFSPAGTLTKDGDHGDVVSIGSYQAKNARDQPKVSAPGLYTLKSVTCGACEGEVQEPVSCLIINPPEPTVTVRSEPIPDTCAGNSVGLRVDLDFLGTPPFVIRYDVVENGVATRQSITVSGMRHQLNLMPTVAGHHKYIFRALDDDIYKSQTLSGPDMVLEQDVKPAASAAIQYKPGQGHPGISACLDEEVEVDVLLYGDAPFTLEWEIIHDGRRRSSKVSDIADNRYTIRTDPLAQGGEYTLALTSIQDRSGCRIFLAKDTKITVRRQRPRAAFGLIDGKQRTLIREGDRARLPLRLSGEGPWKVAYKNLDHDSENLVRDTVVSENGQLIVGSRGRYELVDVFDKQCPGSVDPRASTFEVDWYPRPELMLVQTDSISQQSQKFVKQDVCEGDIDGFEIGLKGSAPYHVEYEVRHKPAQGQGSISRKDFDAALGKASIQMDTSRAGLYTYNFYSLSDYLYEPKRGSFKPVVLEQRVNAKPSAAFVKPGQSFKYCTSEQDNEDTIPITLKGVAPFYVEIEIKHQSGSSPETYRIPSIDSNTYGLQIPRQYLKLGTQQIRIRKVRDSRGCQQKLETGGPSVQIHLFDVPAIYPLETRTDYCVGERIAYTLSGTPPFDVWYSFDGAHRKAKSQTTNFRRIAEAPGEFTITTISDKASECRAAVNLTKTIHPMPSVRISKGKEERVSIHEGGEVDIIFEFWGTPPFEFTYTRSSNAKKGQRSQVLETRHDVSYEHNKVIRASQEGTYEVVAIKDRYCAFSTQNIEAKEGSQKLLKY
ncbi:Titin [Pleurostoma richardsiae]|uniref:Titin n=1 Tax=Pleurostoma richardsiae TaxID=41990 RepID=A0AA38RLQ1_9PEZI|nr:Titin [Pleurostoma richardsiae]